jgi:hypothetical protein
MQSRTFFFVIFFALMLTPAFSTAQDVGVPLRKAFWIVPSEPCIFEASFTERIKQGNFIALDWYNRPVAPFPLVCQISDAFGRQVQQMRYRIEDKTMPVLADLSPGPYTITLRNEQNDVLGTCDFDIAIR